MFAAYLLNAAKSSLGKSKNISHDLKCFARCNRNISNSQQHASRFVILPNQAKISNDGGRHSSFWWALGSRFRSFGLNRFGNSQRYTIVNLKRPIVAMYNFVQANSLNGEQTACSGSIGKIHSYRLVWLSIDADPECKVDPE